MFNSFELSSQCTIFVRHACKGLVEGELVPVTSPRMDHSSIDMSRYQKLKCLFWRLARFVLSWSQRTVRSVCSDAECYPSAVIWTASAHARVTQQAPLYKQQQRLSSPPEPIMKTFCSVWLLLSLVELSPAPPVSQEPPLACTGAPGHAPQSEVTRNVTPWTTAKHLMKNNVFPAELSVWLLHWALLCVAKRLPRSFRWLLGWCKVAKVLGFC